MATSGVELRKSLGYTASQQESAAVSAPARKAQAVVAEPMPHAEPGKLAIGIALAQILIERALGKYALSIDERRLAFAEYARGLALCLALVVQYCWFAMRDGAPGFSGLYQLLNPVALPAFMLTCGLFARRSIGNDWSTHLVRLAPFAAAVAAWALAQTLGAWIAAPRGAMSVATAMHALAPMTDDVPLLLIAPAFALVSRYFRNHPWFLLSLAVLAEMLVLPGRTFGGECMRGMIYFQVGSLFAAKFRMLAREAQADPQMAICAVAVWLALAGLCAFIRIPFAGNTTIVTMPFASLGLGMAGAAALIMGCALLSQRRLFAPLASIGRNWIAFGLAIPIGFQALRASLIGLHAAASPAAADLIIGIAGFAAFAAVVVVAVLESVPSLPAFGGAVQATRNG